MALPDEPPTDELTQYILATYAGIARGRQYMPVFGGRPMPMAIGAREINDWLAGHPSPMERRELDACVFALDAMERVSAAEG